MREILFRGKTGGRWVEGDLQSQAIPLTAILTYEQFEGYGNLVPVYPETVGQFTGLNDKNGKKIFEHDVVRMFSKYHDDWIKGYAEIKFSYGYVGGWIITQGIEYLSLGLHNLEVEVVGNLTDNPELLEVK
jgi:uncharacterized phage protein (TIGR01671 family)